VVDWGFSEGLLVGFFGDAIGADPAAKDVGKVLFDVLIAAFRSQFG
jgi:hypothetical protein